MFSSHAINPKQPYPSTLRHSNNNRTFSNPAISANTTANHITYHIPPYIASEYLPVSYIYQACLDCDKPTLLIPKSTKLPAVLTIVSARITTNLLIARHI